MKNDNTISGEVFAKMASLLDPQARIKKAQDECVLEALASLDEAATMLEEDKKYVLAEAINQIMEIIPKRISGDK